MTDWQNGMHDCESAEDFFELFGVPYDPHLVRVHRLHILQRFHDQLALAEVSDSPEDRFAAHAAALAAAHATFAASTPQREKIFRVFQSLPGEPAFVPLAALPPRPH